MKVSALIARLTESYGDNLDVEVYVSWWDRKIVANYFDNPDGVTEELWGLVVSEVEGDEYAWQGEATDTFIEILREHAEEADIDIDGNEE